MKRKSQEGVTLAELIIAMFIFTVVAIGLNAYLFSAVRSNVSSKQLSAATAVGNKVLEQLRMTPYDSIYADSDTVDGQYVCTWTLDTDTEKKAIQLSVAWPPATAAHEIFLHTIIADN